jgi:arylsulfatase
MSGKTARTGSRPNIILLTTDQQRFDALGINGNAVIRTPHLDRLAGRGVNFSHAFVQNTVCVPSRACIQTGRYTHQHGVRYMETEVAKTPGLPPWEVTFMERLQQAGYHTGAAGKMHMFPEKGFHWTRLTGGKGARWTQQTGLPIGPAPLGQEYAQWLEQRHPGGYEAIYRQRRRGEYRRNHTAIVNDLPLSEHVEFWIKESALEFIAENRDGPFFLWCGFTGPHGPFDPPASHARLYRPQDMPISAMCLAEPVDKPKLYQRRAFRSDDDVGLVQLITARYYALVSLIDDMVGEIVAALRAHGLWDNTLLCLVSDHGEMLGDFGRMGKGVFHESVLRVPLIVVPPGKAERPRRCDELVEAMDIAPTILDYAGVDVPDTMQARSLRPRIEHGAGRGMQCVLSEYASNDRQIHGKCIRTRRHKYVCWANDIGELYDLQADPTESRNLWVKPGSAALVQQYERMLLEKLLASEKPILPTPT